VVHDEIDLDQGRIKVKIGGGHNGHNGLKSIDQYIGKDYYRIRVGVSRPSKIYEKLNQENISKWVLSDFTSNEEINWLNKTLDKITNEINLLITNQIELLNFK
jgi:PTH1 family peptidyl-tRNA hydrolase